MCLLTSLMSQICRDTARWALKRPSRRSQPYSSSYSGLKNRLLVQQLQGYGTVRFETPEPAQAAIQQFHGSDLEGRTLTVRLDKFA